MKTAFTSLFLALGLMGCTSQQPITYLVLSPVGGPVYEAAGSPLAVARVVMPASIDRDFLTTGNGENTMIVSNQAMWAAPLEGQAQTIIARDLAARLPGHKVAMPGDHVPEGAMIVSVNVITFLPYPDHVVLAADWRVTAPEMTSPREGRVRVVVPAGAGAAAQAQGMSQALGQLADKIARQVAD